jgi:hypothetical protein
LAARIAGHRLKYRNSRTGRPAVQHLPEFATIKANLPYSDGLINFHLWGVVMTITICRSQAPGLPKKSFFVTAGTSQRPPLR